MPEEYEDDQEGLERPPAFFPYDPDSPDRNGEESREPIEVEVEGIFEVENAGNVQRFVMLADEDGRKLPISIGLFEATAISFPLNNTQSVRPLSHDLMKNVIERMGGTLTQIVIDDLWTSTYYAKLYLQVENDVVEVDSRPSDAIALALRFGVPIYVTDNILRHSTGE